MPPGWLPETPATGAGSLPAVTGAASGRLPTVPRPVVRLVTSLVLLVRVTWRMAKDRGESDSAMGRMRGVLVEPFTRLYDQVPPNYDGRPPPTSRELGRMLQFFVFACLLPIFWVGTGSFPIAAVLSSSLVLMGWLGIRFLLGRAEMSELEGGVTGTLRSHRTEGVRAPDIPLNKYPDIFLERQYGEEGWGFILTRVRDGQRLSWGTLAWGDGVKSLPVVGVTHRPEALILPDFHPGKEVSLVLEPENEFDPEAIGVWNKDRTAQVGYLPGDSRDKKGVFKRMTQGDVIRAFVMWENRKRSVRVGLRILIVTEDAKLGIA